MTFTDQDILTQIQRVMIETADGGATWGSGFWTPAEVVGYINQRQNRFLKDTHLQIGIGNVDGAIGQAQYDFPDDWIDTVRVLWIDTATNYTKELTRSSSWEADNGIPDWTYQTGTPNLYFDVQTPVTTFKVAPAPDALGTLQVHYVPLAVSFDGGGDIFTIPSEFVPTTIKYGVLADMWGKVGRAQDPERAAYCQQRYQLGEEIARMLLRGWKK